MSNIDIEILGGNPGAVGVRGRYAQHCYLAHMDFRIGSGLAGVHETGNVMEDVSFHGGQYGIWTQTPSPGWQFTAVDAAFEGQREAAIRERAAGLTLIRPQFHNVPTAISIDPESHDELWVKDGRFEDISGPAVIVSLEGNARTEINMENATCRRVPVFAAFRESGRKVAAPGEMYEVKTFSHGLHFSDIGAAPATEDVFEAAPIATMPALAKSDLPDLPARATWVNLRSLGAKGDGVTDDTEVFRQAIAANRAIYLPMGKYVISDTIVLKPDTVLIGLHPSATQIGLRDSHASVPGSRLSQGDDRDAQGRHQHRHRHRPLHQRHQSRARWPRSGWPAPDSMMNDVRFLGGHGTTRSMAAVRILTTTRTRPTPTSVAAGTGSIRASGSRMAAAARSSTSGRPARSRKPGMLVSNTSTEGRIYQMSSEHHVRYEVQMHNASNWRIYALQTEEERGEGGFALPLEIAGSSNITVANFHIYRVISTFQPFP